MNRNEPESARGILGEKVWSRDPAYRPNRPGRVVRVMHSVEVEYNDLNGQGSYVVVEEVRDLVRGFKPFCEAHIAVRNGPFLVTCDMPLDPMGYCPRAKEHVRDEK